MADFRLDDHGSIVVLNALTDEGRQWAADHLAGPEVQTWGRDGTVIEPRYVAPIVEGIRNDGLEVTS